MSLSSLISVVETKLPLRLSAEARARRPELARFETAGAVLAALKRNSAQTAAERYATVAAIVTEHRAHPNPQWPALLLVAFAPMLQILRNRLGPPRDEELDDRVVFAFLEAIASVPLGAGDFMPVALRRATAKKAFESDEPSPADVTSFDEEIHTPFDPTQLSEMELRAEAAWTARRVERLEAERRAASRRVRPLPKRRKPAA
jgi:hypothetical protein